VVDGDGAHARIGIGGHEVAEQGRDPLIDAFEDAAREGGAGERRHHGFGHRLDVDRTIEPRPAEHLADLLLPGAGDEQRVQVGQGCGPRQGLLEQRRIETGSLRLGRGFERGGCRRPPRRAEAGEQGRRGDQVAPADQARRTRGWREAFRRGRHRAGLGAPLGQDRINSVPGAKSSREWPGDLTEAPQPRQCSHATKRTLACASALDPPLSVEGRRDRAQGHGGDEVRQESGASGP
jgi:hypothetical protein